MFFLDLYALILGLTAIILFLLSFRFENIVAGKSVIAELGEMKNNYIFNQRINILLYGAISLSAYFFPFFQNSTLVIFLVLIVMLRGIYYNKKYLNRWTTRK